MSYDLCELEDCFYTKPYSPLSDSSSIGILKALQETNYYSNPFTNEVLDTPFDENDQIAPTTLSSSPSCHHLQSPSIYQMCHSLNSPYLCPLEIKTDETQLPFYDHCIDINSLIESSNLQSLTLTTPDHGFSSSHITSVCGMVMGDLQSSETNQPVLPEGSFVEESYFKVGRYGPEERKEKILRYKAKRTQRNFNKTIKYACRKTLADNRPRIRGRFARNDEPEENLKTFTFQRYENDDELWMDGLQEVHNERIPRGHFLNTYMSITKHHQFKLFS